jgi:hypothetical protein
MREQADNPYRPPQRAEAPPAIPLPATSRPTSCVAVVAVSCCLVVHAILWVRWEYFMAETLRFDRMAATLLVLGVIIGTPSSVFALRQEGAVKRALGAIGLAYFVCYILLAIAES